MAVNRILYFYLLILISIFFVLFDVYLFHLIWVFLLLLPVVLFVCTLPVCRAVTCRLDVADDIVPRGRCAIRITAKNSAPLPCACVRIHIDCRNALGRAGEHYLQQSEEILQLSIGARTHLVLHPALRNATCGRMDFTIRRIEICDLLGLVSLRVPAKNILSASGSVYVLPALKNRTLPLEDAADIGLDSATYSLEKPGGDPSETFQLRDYREGDSLHSVHWKLSGRMQRLIVREFGLPLNPSLHFLLALTPNATPRAAEDLLGTALAFSEYLLSQEVVHCISFLQDDGILHTVNVTDESALALALHALLALPAYRQWQALESFAAEPEAQSQSHLIYLIAGAEWSNAAEAEASKMLESLLALGACRQITLMPDSCPAETAHNLSAVGCDVQLLSGQLLSDPIEIPGETP